MHTEPIKPANYTIPDACRAYGIGRTTLYERIKTGDIRTIKLGSRTLIPAAELEAYFAKLWQEQHGDLRQASAAAKMAVESLNAWSKELIDFESVDAHKKAQAA